MTGKNQKAILKWLRTRYESGGSLDYYTADEVIEGSGLDPVVGDRTLKGLVKKGGMMYSYIDVQKNDEKEIIGYRTIQIEIDNQPKKAPRGLKPPLNYRSSSLKCCGTCKHLIGESQYAYAVWHCERDANRETTEVIGPLEETYRHVCDYWSEGNPMSGL